jgi:D-serine deaminase-like pyridoxal phosphate-dependent protein
VNLHNEIYVAEGETVIDRWSVIARGRVR